MNVAAWLMALVGPLARKVLISLGLAVVSYTGVDLALGALLTQARTGWGSMPSAVAVYMQLCGANTALAIIAGALTARVSLIPLKRFDFI